MLKYSVELRENVELGDKSLWVYHYEQSPSPHTQKKTLIIATEHLSAVQVFHNRNMKSLLYNTKVSSLKIAT